MDGSKWIDQTLWPINNPVYPNSLLNSKNVLLIHCPACPFFTFNYNRLLEHLSSSTHTGTIECVFYRCSQCDKVSTSSVLLKEHYTEQHNIHKHSAPITCIGVQRFTLKSNTDNTKTNEPNSQSLASSTTCLLCTFTGADLQNHYTKQHNIPIDQVTQSVLLQSTTQQLLKSITSTTQLKPNNASKTSDQQQQPPPPPPPQTPQPQPDTNMQMSDGTLIVIPQEPPSTSNINNNPANTNISTNPTTSTNNTISSNTTAATGSRKRKLNQPTSMNINGTVQQTITPTVKPTTIINATTNNDSANVNQFMTGNSFYDDEYEDYDEDDDLEGIDDDEVNGDIDDEEEYYDYEDYDDEDGIDDDDDEVEGYDEYDETSVVNGDCNNNHTQPTTNNGHQNGVINNNNNATANGTDRKALSTAKKRRRLMVMKQESQLNAIAGLSTNSNSLDSFKQQSPMNNGNSGLLTGSSTPINMGMGNESGRQMLRKRGRPPKISSHVLAKDEIEAKLRPYVESVGRGLENKELVRLAPGETYSVVVPFSLLISAFDTDGVQFLKNLIRYHYKPEQLALFAWDVNQRRGRPRTSVSLVTEQWGDTTVSLKSLRQEPFVRASMHLIQTLFQQAFPSNLPLFINRLLQTHRYYILGGGSNTSTSGLGASFTNNPAGHNPLLYSEDAGCDDVDSSSATTNIIGGEGTGNSALFPKLIPSASPYKDAERKLSKFWIPCPDNDKEVKLSADSPRVKKQLLVCAYDPDPVRFLRNLIRSGLPPEELVQATWKGKNTGRPRCTPEFTSINSSDNINSSTNTLNNTTVSSSNTPLNLEVTPHHKPPPLIEHPLIKAFLEFVPRVCGQLLPDNLGPIIHQLLASVRKMHSMNLLASNNTNYIDYSNHLNLSIKKETTNSTNNTSNSTNPIQNHNFLSPLGVNE